MIPGLKIVENALSEDGWEEVTILKNIFEVMPQLGRPIKGGRTNIVRYGWSYDAPHKWTKDIPSWLQTYCNLFGTDSVTINHYLPGSGIRPHKDSLDFADPVRILNLGSGVDMLFTKAGHEEVVHIPRRSMTVLGGESRYDWEHSIPAISEARWSIVFRKLNKEFYTHNKQER